MTARRHILIFFTVIFLLQGNWLSAQEYLDLWRGGKTDNFYLIQKKFNEYFAHRDNKRGIATQKESEGSEYVQFKRWEAFMEPRVYPSGKLINPAKLALDEELRYSSRSRSTQSKSPVPGNYWSSLGIEYYTRSKGWTGGMGRVNCIAPHPTNSQTLFIGTPAGGIWKTTDGGLTWTPLSDGIPLIGVSGIAINPSNPDSIYILTGDGDGCNTSSTGVLLTTNGGQTWQSTGLKWNANQQIYGYKLLMHPTDSKIMFVAAIDGIHKTTDGGLTWAIKKEDFFTDIAFKPGDPLTMYATARNSYSFYRSTNGGNTWMPVTSLGLLPGRTAIGVTPASPAGVWLVSGDYSGGANGGYNGVLKSLDNGQTFSFENTSPNILGRNIKFPWDNSTQAPYDLAIAVSPADANEIHLGGINCWRSMNAGTNWNWTSNWLQTAAPPGHYTHADIHSLVFGIDNRLYCGSDGGIFYSDNHATPNAIDMSWYDISKGLEITQFYSIAAPANDLNTLYGGTQDNGLNKWTAPAVVMDHQVAGDVVQCLVNYNNSNKVYALPMSGSVIFFTQNGGANWFKDDQLLLLTGRNRVPLIMHPTDPTRLYAGYNKVALLNENALGQMVFNSAISPDMGTPLVALGMSAANSSYMYAATPTVLKRCNNILAAPNTTWTDITVGLPVANAQIISIQVSPTNVNEVWVCFSGYAAGKKIYYTSDGGSTWTNISGTLPNVPVNCIAYHDKGQDGIYIGTDIGVFYKDNTMNDWEPFRNGLPNVMIYDLEITQNKIRAATFGRGIWQSDLRGNVCVENYTLSGDITGYQSLWANTISSTANVIGGKGTEVYYKAGTNITLGTGFKVVPESEFKAEIGDCNTNGLAARQYDGVYDGVMSGAVGVASGVDSVAVQTNRLKVYPNPFSGQSTIEFYIAKQTPVTISLWDLSGKKIKDLFSSNSQSPGNYQVRLEVAGLRSGTYFVRLQANDYEETQKAIIAQ